MYQALWPRGGTLADAHIVNYRGHLYLKPEDNERLHADLTAVYQRYVGLSQRGEAGRRSLLVWVAAVALP